MGNTVMMEDCCSTDDKFIGPREHENPQNVSISFRVINNVKKKSITSYQTSNSILDNLAQLSVNYPINGYLMADVFDSRLDH